ncbi:alpha/beta-hydrolase family protein [Pseudonocardia sp. N23]|uniref:alpha/beta hydrolase n=1 Tax=Pseudonocardia sp. N23 TaxID=1987376 RepID=UPI000BFB9934|nr:alpha/beta hydrolase [Pseudonocardia sp. N23]GAY08337.1 membrane protein [Pseudonocardia sp. N23]
MVVTTERADEQTDRVDDPPRAVRRWFAPSLPGLWGGLALACLSFTPSLLPRSGVLQGAVAGIGAILGYGLGVLAALAWRAFAGRDPRRARRGSVVVFAVVVVVLVAAAVVAGRHWQGRLRELMGAPAQSWGDSLLAVPVAALAFLVLLALCRLLFGLGRGIGWLLSRWMGRRGARALGGLLVGGLVVHLVSGVALDGMFAAADRAFAAANDATPEGVTRPASDLRSGGPESLIDWDSLGREGRVFVAGGPSAADIAAFTGTRAADPVRVYAGVDSAATADARAALAVADLERAGGFDRARLLVATTTGQGWLDAGAMSSFEYVAGGDSAIVALQYSFVPSGFSYLVDASRAQAAGRALFDAVYGRWASLPVDRRPQLYVFGESLGSFGAEAAFSGESDLRNRTSGALFVGPPNFNALHTEFRDDRDPGSREVEPVYRDGRTVRFSTDVAVGAPPAGAPWDGSRTLILQHPSDPITWWSPQLLFSRPDWLAEPRGRDVLPSMTWLPIVTFWQVTLDMPAAAEVPEGHGHRYTRESVDAWALLLRPPDWTPQKADQLRAILAGT